MRDTSREHRYWCRGCRQQLVVGVICPDCGDRHGVRREHLDDDDPLLGTRLGERWSIVARLGRGGYGGVYLALEQPSLETVAVKVLHGARTRPEDIARFRREAQALALLDHPNIVGFYTSGEVETPSGTLYFYVMESFEGARTLTDVIRRGGFADDAATWNFFRGVLSGLEAAHGEGVLHRDLKPANLLVVDGEARIVDLGLARSVQGGGAQRLDAVTDENERAFRGTAAYASPEQLRGGILGPRSDIYSLGCILYELWCGERPWRGTTRAIFDTRQHHPNQPFTTDAFAALDPARQDLLLSTMNLHAASRMESAAALSEALSRALGVATDGDDEDEPLSSTRELPLRTPTATPTPTKAPTEPEPPAAASRSGAAGRVATLVAGLAVVGLLVVVVLRLTHDDEPKARSDEESSAPLDAPPVVPVAATPRAPQPQPEGDSVWAASTGSVQDALGISATMGGVGASQEPLTVVEVLARGDASLARMSDGSVRAWGHRMALGREGENDSATPIEVPRLKNVRSLFATQASEGRLAVCAQAGASQMWCWGDTAPMPDQSHGTWRREPQRILRLERHRRVSLSGSGGGYLAYDETLWAWGAASSRPQHIDNLTKPLEDFALSAMMVCVLERDSGVVRCGLRASVTASTFYVEPIPLDAPARRVALGGPRGCALLKDDSLRCWGITRDVSEVARDVLDFDLGEEGLCWVHPQGSVWCQAYASEEAVLIAGAGDATQVSVGSAHACVRTRTGSVSCWGSNRLGQLGDGTLEDREEARPVMRVQERSLPESESGSAAWLEAHTEAPLTSPCPKPLSLVWEHPHQVRGELVPTFVAKYPGEHGRRRWALADYPLEARGEAIALPRAQEHRLELVFKAKATDTLIRGGSLGPGLVTVVAYDRYGMISPWSVVSVRFRVVEDWLCGELDVQDGVRGRISGTLGFPR